MSSSPDTTETDTNSGDPEPTSAMLSGSWVSFVLHVIGVVFALSPLHWFVAGIIFAGLGTLFFSTSLRTDMFTEHPVGSRERLRGRTLGLRLVIYGLFVVLAGVGSAVVGVAVGPGIVLAVMAVVPVGIGIRQLCAAADRHPIQAFHARPRLKRGVCRVVLVGFFALVTVSSVVAGTSGGIWFPILLVVVCVFVVGLPIAVLNPKGAVGGAFVVCQLLLAFAAAVGGPSAWLTIVGNPPQECKVVDSIWHHSSRSADSITYEVQCGQRVLPYKSLHSTSPIVDNEPVFITDSTGLSRPLHVLEVPSIRGNVFLGLYGVTALLLILNLIPRRQRGALAEHQNGG